MESALRAPNGDITVILVPEHHQAHKELCKDKQDNLILLYFLKGEGMNAKTLTCCLMALTIISIQLFWK